MKLKSLFSSEWSKRCISRALPLLAVCAMGLAQTVQAGISDLVVTEIQSDAVNSATGGDYWELTNNGTTAVDISNWKWNDSARVNTGSAVTIPSGTTIAAGESIIFTGVNAATFRTWWGISGSVQVISATSPGLGSNDGISLFTDTGTEVLFLSYAASGFTRSSGSAATGGHAGVSAGGAAKTALILDPTFATLVSKRRYTAAVAGTFGVFTSATPTSDAGSPGVSGLPTAVDLSLYTRVGRYDLPEPTRTTPPDAVSLLAQEASGVAYNWDTDSLFICADGGTSVVQVSKTGQLIDSMTLAPGASPQGTDFYDPEGITYVGNGQFVMSEERDRQVVLFTYAAGTTLSRSGAKTVKLGTFVPNTGTEGLSYDPQTGGFICLKEIDPLGLFQTNIDFDAGTATNGSASTVNSTNLFDPALTGMLDFADVFALSNIPAMSGKPDAARLLVLSQESANIVNIDRSGNIFSTLTIQSDPGNPLSAAAQQHEGLTMDRNGILYVVSENGGGDFDHPQLWVYAPSSVPNQAPTAVALNNAVTTIVENSSTATRVKVADIAVTDDGLGTNVLTVTGTDASVFEIVAGALYIKAGTVLDYETQTSYSAIVNVDDTSLGGTPDATANYSLTVTNVVDETPVLPSLIISEVTPWSSGNSPVGADWFEVTNTGSTAVNITGWKVDDSSASFASALVLNGITSIAAGESVIFIETADLPTTSAAFLSNWFGASPPAGLQIGSYTGSGIGLSTGGDAVNLYNSAGELQASVSFGASPVGPTFPTFNNAAGLNNTVIATLSAAGVNGAFTAANDAVEIGSPGTVGKLFISEVAPWSSSSPIGADWFEVTNTKAQAVNIAGWKVDDGSESFAAALALSGITSIAPGESVIFMETDDLPTKSALFRSTWFGGSPPAGLQIGSYTGGGIGLSTGGDAVNLYNSVGVHQARVSFGAAPAGPSFPTFDNTVGLNLATISQLSVAGVNGAFAAVNDANEIGSPGSATLASPALALTVSVTPSSFSESAANPAASGTVTRTGSTLNELLVSLASNDETEATVPATVTILAGNASANFNVTAVDDSFPDGNKTVTLTASASGADAGNFDITVNDDGDVAVSYKLVLTEVQSNQATASMNDYWELTNAGTSAVDLGNWKWTDSARTVVGAITIPVGTSIAAGESIILTGLPAATFRSWWGIDTSVQVISGTSTPGLGMNDGLTLFDGGGNEVLFFSYAASGFTRSNGSGAAGGHAGVSGGGTATQALVLDPTYGFDTPRYTAAAIGVFAAFASTGSALDIGSPGKVDVPPAGGAITFSSAIYSVDQGSETVALTVTRSGGTAPTSVTINTNDGTVSTVPPFAAALATTDYTDLAGAATTLNFAQDEMSKSVNVTLIPKTALNTPNKRFTATLSSPTGTATLGAVSTATVRILAANGASPTLKITTPASVLDSAAWPYMAKGTAGSALGVDRVEVALNGGAAVPATLGSSMSNAAVPWSVNLNPVSGLNTLLVTVFDLSGNSSTVRRVFNFTRRYVMTLTRVVPSAITATPDTAGTVAMLATPATAATALAPANANPKTTSIVPGTVVKITATPKAGYSFSHWSGTPVGTVYQGNVITFTMPVGDPAISATFVENPFFGPVGGGTSFFGLLHAGAGTESSNATEGFLTGTLTASTGIFSGRVLIDGVTQSFITYFYGDGSGMFQIGTNKFPQLSFGGRSLTLSFAGGVITGTVTKGTDISTGTAARALYSATNKVPAPLLNSTIKGFYTVGFPSKVQDPAAALSSYPQGDGFGTLNVTNLGVVTLTGTLADGTLVTASSALVAGNTCPIFVQLTTPGAAATVKGGSFGGVLTFDATPADSDVSGTDLLWFRPAVTALTTPAAAALATNIYTAGWPEGITVDAVGALYATTTTVQNTLGAAVIGTANAKVVFADGKLTSSITKSNLNISGNAATKIPTTDATYTVALAPATGGFSGTFTPNWASPSMTKPAYKGILIQKGANKGGYGFFLSNATGDLDPESGGVTLSKNP